MPDTKEENSWQYQLALDELVLAKGNFALARSKAEQSIYCISESAWQWAAAKYQRLHTGSPA